MEQILKRLEEVEKRLAKLEKKRSTKAQPSEVAEIRGVFLSEYEKRFKHPYVGWGAKENGMAAQWLKSVPFEKALLYAKIYPHWKEKRAIAAGHPFYLLVQNYVQLEAHIRRHKALVDDIIDARARENVEIGSKVKDQEVIHYGNQHKAGSNQSLIDHMQDEIQTHAEPKLLGPRSEPT